MGLLQRFGCKNEEMWGIIILEIEKKFNCTWKMHSVRFQASVVVHNGFCSSEMLHAGTLPGSREAARLQQPSSQIKI
jgi:hypothetical protein